MDNRDIFNFDFVDRVRQQQILTNFMDSSENYLWIDGESGVGKSFLIEKKMLNNPYRNNNLYINLSTDYEKNNCLNELITSLQDFANISFTDFIIENYSSIFDVAKKTIFEIVKFKTPNLDWFFDILYDSNMVFFNKNKEKSTSLKIVELYIRKILLTNKLCIILDNFTYCDKKSFLLLSQLFYHYINISNFQCIFLTTTDILKDRTDIQILLAEQLPVRRLKIESLDNVKYFYTILDNVFEIDDMMDIIPDIYNLCSGNPERLKSLIRKLYLNDGIYLPQSKYTRAKINSNILHNLLLIGTFDLSYTDFTENERFIILIMLGFGGSAELNIFHECVMYIHNKLFCGLLWSPIIINNIVQDLISKNILEIDIKINQIIRFIHDKTFFGMQILFENDINKSLISHYFYLFLLDNEQDASFNLQDLHYLKIQHAYIARESCWLADSYEYAYNKYLQKKFFDAVPIFKRILQENMNLTITQRIVLAETFYETGDYYSAKSMLSNYKFSDEHSTILYHYYFLLGKTENILLNKSKAIIYYNKALQYAQNRESEILILHLKHLALLETPVGKAEAETIFNSIALNLSNAEKNMLSVSYLLRNCNQFYTGDVAKQFFELALDISIKHGSQIDEAYVHNNYGLEFFRTNYIDEAYEKFKTSYRILSDTKFHEMAYPLNNMAVCEMFRGNYTQAIEYLTEGKYINQSIYAGLAIKVHLMVCYRMLSEEKQCRKYMNQLKKYLEDQKISDFNIIRKLSINLCISYLHYGENLQAKECLEKSLQYIPGTISEYRGCALNNQLNEKKLDSSDALQSNFYYTRLDFEPWVITLSHD